MPLKPVYDRALLLLGPKRDKVLTLEEVRQYGVDSFSDPDYLRIYGIAPAAWNRQGIGLLGRTAVECTRDALASLDLRCTMQPITDVIRFIKTTYPRQRVFVAIQVYEKLNPASLREIQALLDWSALRIYDLNAAGKNHGILLGTSGWKPSS